MLDEPLTLRWLLFVTGTGVAVVVFIGLVALGVVWWQDRGRR